MKWFHLGISFIFLKQIFSLQFNYNQFFKTIQKNNLSGLGLSIAKKIIESFSGSIKLTNLKSQKYFGACFEINLPLKD